MRVYSSVVILSITLAQPTFVNWDGPVAEWWQKNKPSIDLNHIIPHSNGRNGAMTGQHPEPKVDNGVEQWSETLKKVPGPKSIKDPAIDKQTQQENEDWQKEYPDFPKDKK